MNNQGFSLIECMVALGLVSAATLALAQQTVNSSLTQNYADFRLETNSLASSLVGNVSNDAGCTSAFQGVTFDPALTDIPLTLTLPNKTIAAGTALPNYKLTVKGLTFSNYKVIQVNNGITVYFGDLVLTTQALRNVLGPKTSSITLNSVYLTASGAVTACNQALTLTLPSPVPTPTPTQVIPTPVTDDNATRTNTDPCQH
jgi:prepilin-type N-terminal cleavage/methylation domain-containing protein